MGRTHARSRGAVELAAAAAAANDDHNVYKHLHTYLHTYIPVTIAGFEVHQL